MIGYRVEHWMYDTEECIVDESDVTKVFPKWRETWSKGNSEKYKYYYMGFGNGLCVDKSIVNIFEQHLESCINERAKLENLDPNEYRMSLMYNVWLDAAYLTIKELKYV